MKWPLKGLLSVSFIVVAALSSFAFVDMVERNEASITAAELQGEWMLARPMGNTLKSGDLVFRHARGTISNMLMRFSLKDPKYSHAGIVSIESDTVFVYHSLGGEATRNSVIRKEKLDQFCNPKYVHSFGIYRLDLNFDQASKAASYARALYVEKVPFDTKFDLNTDSALYCTEFVYKVLLRASGDINYLTLTRVPGFTYVACDDLYKNKHASLVYSYTYPN